jgi:hypothetical protein
VWLWGGKEEKGDLGEAATATCGGGFRGGAWRRRIDDGAGDLGEAATAAGRFGGKRAATKRLSRARVTPGVLP